MRASLGPVLFFTAPWNCSVRAAYLPKEVVCAHAPAHAEGLIVPGGHTRAITYRLAKKKITTMKYMEDLGA